MPGRDRLRLFLSDYQNQIHTEAEKLMALPIPELTEELFSQFEKTGNRSRYENVYFARRKFLTVLGLKALLEKGEAGRISCRTLEKLSGVIREICREECWAVPAHLSRENPDWRLAIDLFAAETAQTLSELADRLREEMAVELYALIRENVEKRVLNHFFASRKYGWEKSDHNWNAVCTGAIGSACIHLWERGVRTDACLQRICDSLEYYIEGFADDGTCMEGCGYFTYGMSYFVNFAQELYGYSGGKTDLLRGEWGRFGRGEADKRPQIASFQSKCFFPDGTVVNFSDGNHRDKFRVGLQLALKNHFPEVTVPDLSAAADLFQDNCWRFVFRKLDLLETRRYLDSGCGDIFPEPQSAGSTCHVLPDAQWCIASALNGTGMACKGGHNAEPHNHNDVGHFIYEREGTTFLADLGAGEYTRDYFGEKRYEILCNSSFGHSVPIISGRGQLPGKEYRCRRFETDVTGNVLTVKMELSDAWGEWNGSLSRKLEFSLLHGGLRVTDTFVSAQGETIRENLITRCTPVVEKNRVLLSEGDRTAVLTVAGVEGVSVTEQVHSNHQGVQESVYAICWEVDPREGCSVFQITAAR